MSTHQPIQITPIQVGELLPEGHPMPLYVHVIEHPQARVLVDTGITQLHKALDDLNPTLGPAAIPRLDAIDIMVNTHLHADHCGGNHLFPGRPIYGQQQELDDARTQPAYTLIEWVDAPGVSYCPVDGELELLPGIRLLPAPGHTRGSQIVVVDAGPAPDIIVGDTAVWGAELDAPQTEGQHLIRRLAPRRAWMSHDHMPWTSLNRARSNVGDAYDTHATHEETR